MTHEAGPLTPVQARVLLRPNDVPAKDALRTALVHLVALGHLAPEREPKRGLFSSAKTRYHRKPGSAPLPPHLSVVLHALYPPGKPDKALGPTDLVHRLQQAFGYDYGKYLSRHVRPGLVERGLLQVEAYTTLGIIPRRRYRYTPVGERQRDEVQRMLARADEVPRLLRSDPRAAVGVVAGLGGLALLADALRPHYAELGEAVRALSADALLNLEEDDERRVDWMDVLDIMASVDWNELLNGIESIGDAFDGGADGGGDGGGGGGE